MASIGHLPAAGGSRSPEASRPSQPSQAIRVLLVDDQVLVRDGVKQVLRAERDIEIIGECGSEHGELERHLDRRPDVVIMDIVLSHRDGVEAIRAVRQRCQNAKVLVLTTNVNHEVFRRAASAGAEGYVLKDVLPVNLVNTVRVVHRGSMTINPEIVRHVLEDLTGHGPAARAVRHQSYGLTAREVEVLSRVAEGLSDKEIASALFLSEATVKSHLRSVYQKLKLRNRAQAVAFAVSKGVLGR